MPATSALVLLKWMFYKLICAEGSTFVRLFMSNKKTHSETDDKVAGDKGISNTKSKQQSPCSNFMHRPVTSWGNACSTCIHKPERCMHGLWLHRLMHALTAWDLKFQVCLGYTLTPAALD